MEEQVKSFPEMAYNNIHGLQIITKEEYKSMTIAAKSCSADAHKCKTESNPLIAQLTCQKATNCEEEFFKPLGNNGRNISIYDITKPVSWMVSICLSCIAIHIRLLALNLSPFSSMRIAYVYCSVLENCAQMKLP